MDVQNDSTNYFERCVTFDSKVFCYDENDMIIFIQCIELQDDELFALLL